MNLVGLTGNIGAGKSLVAGMFTLFGIPVYESDSRAKDLMHQPEVRSRIIELLGEEAYDEHNLLNRPWIATQVFNDETLLQKLNAIVHPAVYKDLQQWAKDHATAPYLIQESAILMEENLLSRFKACILVVAPEDIRIDRVMKRDQVSRDQVTDRMKHQWPDEKKIPYADYVIYNDVERSLIDQVKDIDMSFRHLIVNVQL